MEERPVDVVVALVLVLLVIGFLGFANPGAIIPRFGSVQPEVRTETPPTPSHKIRQRHRATIGLPANDFHHRKAAKAMLVLMLGFAPGGG